MPVIDGLEYPSYVYHPYPKWIKLPTGEDVIVQDAYEHQATLDKYKEEGSSQSTTVVEDEVSVPDSIDKNTLIARCEELGITYDKRWGIAKLQDTISFAEEALEAPEVEVGEAAEALPDESVAE